VILNVKEIRANLILFMLAGYETTSTALAYASYVLGRYPEEQAKLFDEISSLFNNETYNEISADNVQKMEYLDMFVKEVLRYYPIGNS
jgi:cytochrome P450 family 4